MDLRESGLFIPADFNLLGIDAVHVAADSEAKTAHVVPIQITIGRSHRDTEAYFCSQWAEWTERFVGYAVTSTSVWIVDDPPGGAPFEPVIVPEHKKHVRGEDISVHPEYTRVRIPISYLSMDIAQSLKAARRRHETIQ